MFGELKTKKNVFIFGVLVEVLVGIPEKEYMSAQIDLDSQYLISQSIRRLYELDLTQTATSVKEPCDESMEYNKNTDSGDAASADKSNNKNEEGILVSLVVKDGMLQLHDKLSKEKTPETGNKDSQICVQFS